MKQQVLYEPVKIWLEDKGFKVLIAGNRTKIVVPVSDLASMASKIPDLIGVNQDNRVVIIEVEKDKKRFFEAMGRCMLWRCIATFVYLAYPKGVISRAPVLSKLGIGLLEVDGESYTVKELIDFQKQGLGLMGILELHPTDYKREQQLAEQIKSTLV